MSIFDSQNKSNLRIVLIIIINVLFNTKRIKGQICCDKENNCAVGNFCNSSKYNIITNNTNIDSCEADIFCKMCGDGIIQKNLYENCDDNNRNNYDGCDSYCRKECAVLSFYEYEKDNLIEEKTEQCGKCIELNLETEKKYLKFICDYRASSIMIFDYLEEKCNNSVFQIRTKYNFLSKTGMNVELKIERIDCSFGTKTMISNSFFDSYYENKTIEEEEKGEEEFFGIQNIFILIIVLFILFYIVIKNKIISN